MKPFTLKTELVSIDKSSKNINKITQSYDKMSKTVTRESRIAGVSFNSFSQSIGFGAKKALVSMNTLNASINRSFANMKKKLGSLGSLGVGFGALAIGRNIINANVEVDASLQSLQAITGVTGKAFESFAYEIDRVAKKEKEFKGDIAKVFELVGSAKPDLLSDARALAEVSNQAIILGKAGKLLPDEAVNALTVSLNQFGAGANKAAMFTDILATAQQKGSGNIQYLKEAVTRSGSTMATFNQSFEDTVVILEGFAKAGIESSVAGTALSSIMGKLAKTNIKEFNPSYTNSVNIIDNLAKANLSYLEVEKLVGAEQAKYLLALINQNQIVQELKGNLNEVGNAQKQANLQTTSFGQILKQIGNSFRNAITSTEYQSDSMQRLKGILSLVADNMTTIIGAISSLVFAFVAFKGIVWLSNIAVGLYNVAIGIAGALSGSAAIGIGASTIALKAYNIMSGIATAATWLFSAALWSTGIPLIVLAVSALIAGIILLVKNFDKVSEVATRVGKVILSFLLAPIEAVLWAINKLSGGKWANDALANIRKLRTELTEKEIKVSSISATNTLVDPSQLKMKGLLENKSYAGAENEIKRVEVQTKEDKLTFALDKNSEELEKNTTAFNKEWAGKFKTSILKDANVSEGSMVQRELALNLLANENSVVSEQKSIISEPVSQINKSQRSATLTNGTITINVVDKTGGNFALEVEGTGINVITTGNG